VPLWAADGNNSVRGDGAVFRQQTNVVYIEGGTFRSASVASAPVPTATETATTTPGPATIDHTALPTGSPPIPIVNAVDHTGAQPISAAYDGDPATVWQSDPAWSTATLAIDLGQPVTLSTVAWLQMEEHCGTLERIESSLDGESWTPLNQITPVVPGKPGVWQALPATDDARYIRWVVVTTPDQATPPAKLGCLAEIAVWGTPIPADEPAAPPPTETTAPPMATEAPAPRETATPELTPTESPTEVVTETVETPAEPAETAPPPEESDESGGA
jgi:hypothetical protein